MMCQEHKFKPHTLPGNCAHQLLNKLLLVTTNAILAPRLHLINRQATPQNLPNQFVLPICYCDGPY